MTSHTATLFTIATGASEPIYRQLIEQVRRLVASGQLAAGDTLPSVRDMAQALALNPMTVSKAYGMLEAEGLLTRRRGLGMQVAGGMPAGHSAASRLALLQPTLARAAHEASQLELDPESVLELFATLLKKGA